MATETLEVIIKANADSLQKVTGSAGTALSGLANIGKTVLVAGLAAGTAAVGLLATGLGFAIKEAMGAQEVIAQLDAVLTSTGGAAGVTKDMALDLADSLSQVTRYSDDAILAGENMLLTFTNIGKDIFPEATQAILDLSTATGQDLQSSAVQLGKALNDPIAGITALSRVGVTFTEEQKAAIASMVEMGDVAGAQTLILAELEKEFGGSAEAAGQTFAGQLDILKNSLSNVAEGVGMAMLPALQEMSGALMENVLPLIKEFGAWLEINLPIAIEAFSTYWTDTLQPALVVVWAWMKACIVPALADLWNWLSINLPIAGQILSDFWTNTLHPALIIVGDWITTTLVPALSDLWNWLSINLPIAVQTLSDFWTNTLHPAIMAVWEWMENSLFPTLQSLAGWYLGTYIPTALQVLSDIWTGVLLPAINTVWNWMVGSLFPTLSELWTWLSETLTTAIQSLSDFWTGTLKPALDTVWAFMQDSLIPLLQVLGELFAVTLLAAVTLLTDYWTGTLQPALDKLWGFVKDFLQPVLDNLAAFWESVIGPAIENAMPVLEDLQSFFDGLQTTISGIIGFVQTLIDKINTIPGLPGSGDSDTSVSGPGTQSLTAGGSGGLTAGGKTTGAATANAGTQFTLIINTQTVNGADVLAGFDMLQQLARM